MLNVLTVDEVLELTRFDKMWVNSMKFFSTSCHQKRERSFFVKGYQFPVCARCTGLYIGYFLGIFNLILSINIYYLFSLTIPFVLDTTLQYGFNIMSNNFRRIISGILFGFFLTAILIDILIFFIEY